MRVKTSQGIVPAGFGVVEGRYGFVAGFAALHAQNHHLVAGLDAGNLRDVKNDLIHADAADERRALARTSRLKRLPRERVRPSPYPAETSARRMGSVATKVAL
jgi:hypothetical protein